MKMKEMKEAARKLGEETKREGERVRVKVRERESVFCVGVCVSAGRRTSKSLQSKRLLRFFLNFFFNPTKASLHPPL